MRQRTTRKENEGGQQQGSSGHPSRPFPVQAKSRQTASPENDPAEIARPAAGGSPLGANFSRMRIFPERPSSGQTGTPLPQPVRQKMEAAFATDFSDVRVHQGRQALSLAAVAFTQGRDIHFRPGAYDPGTRRGQELLGHELTHVVQQKHGLVRSSTRDGGVGINNSPELERQADAIGAKAARGESSSGLQYTAEGAKARSAGEGNQSSPSAVLQMKQLSEDFDENEIFEIEQAKREAELEDLRSGNYSSRVPGDSPKVDLGMLEASIASKAALGPKGGQESLFLKRQQRAERQRAGEVQAGPVDTDALSEVVANKAGLGPKGGQESQFLREQQRAERQRASEVKPGPVDTDALSEVVANKTALGPKGGQESLFLRQQNRADKELAHTPFIGPRVKDDTSIRPSEKSSTTQQKLTEHLEDTGRVFNGPGPTLQGAWQDQLGGKVSGKGLSETGQQALRDKKAMLEQHLIDSGRAKAGATTTFTRESLGLEDKLAERKRIAEMGMGAPAVRARSKLKVNTSGGLDEAVREMKSSEILHGMERAINQNKVADKLEAAGKSQEDIHNLLAKDSSGPKDPESVASSQGVTTNFAHFVGRHGAPEAKATPSEQETAKKSARADQLARVAAGVNPDQKSGAALGTPATISVPDPADTSQTIDLPNYTSKGADRGKNSGGFSSHQAQLFAIEESLGQAWNRVGTEKTSRVPANTTVDVSYVKKQQQPNNSWITTDPAASAPQTLSRPTNWQGNRYGVDVTLPTPGGTKNTPLFEGGFGESFKYTGSTGLPNPLTQTDLRDRVANTTSIPDQQGAKVILDQDTKRGGFSVQTAYPQVPDPGLPGGPNTSSDVTANYSGTVLKEEKTNKRGRVTTTTKNYSEDVSLPEVVGSGDAEQQLQESLQRIQNKGETVEYEIDPLTRKPKIGADGKPIWRRKRF